METLHIYAQACWHDEVWIAGNREGLTRLRDAIDKALMDGKGMSDHVFATDGEGYRVMVMRLTDADLGQLMLPYTDDFSAGGGTAWPWTLVPNAKVSGARDD